MGHLNKQQYERRRENAVSRNIKNEDIAVANGMTQEQAELISELCSMRHNLHSDIEHLVYDSSKELRALIELYTDKTFMIHEQWGDLNRKIETYLSEIDEKYNTKYAPTGALRIL